MGKDFVVTVHQPERREEFASVFGTHSVNVLAPVPLVANLPGFPEDPVYLLDLAEITPAQRERLVSHLSQKFGLSREIVDRELEEHGMPIRAVDCSVMIFNPQRWLP